MISTKPIGRTRMARACLHAVPHTQRAVLGGNSSRTPDRAAQTGTYSPPSSRITSLLHSACQRQPIFFPSPTLQTTCSQGTPTYVVKSPTRRLQSRIAQGMRAGGTLERRSPPSREDIFPSARTMEWTRTTVWTHIRQLRMRLKDTARYYGAQ